MRTLKAARQEDLRLVYTSNSIYVANIFARVDGTTNICQQYKAECKK